MAAKIDFGHDEIGWLAFVSEDNDLVIGHESDEVYRGNFEGLDTPHIFDIMRDDIYLFAKIIKYYNWNAIPFLHHVACEGYDRAITDVIHLLPKQIYTNAIIDAVTHNEKDINKVVLKVVENISNYYCLMHKE